jgi:hypothetical protein
MCYGGFLSGGDGESGAVVLASSSASMGGGSGSTSMDGLRTKRASPQMAVRELGPNLAVFSEALAAEGSVVNYSANSDGSVAVVYNHQGVPFKGSFEVPSSVHKILMNEFCLLATTVPRVLGPMQVMAQSCQNELAKLRMAEVQSRCGITGSAGDVIVAGSLRGLPVDVWADLFTEYGISNPPGADRTEAAKLIEMISDVWQTCYEGKYDGKADAVLAKGHEIKYRSHYKSIPMRALSGVTVRTGTARSKANGIEWKYNTTHGGWR